jgi:hypothetical protein
MVGKRLIIGNTVQNIISDTVLAGKIETVKRHLHSTLKITKSICHKLQTNQNLTGYIVLLISKSQIPADTIILQLNDNTLILLKKLYILHSVRVP